MHRTRTLAELIFSLVLMAAVATAQVPPANRLLGVSPSHRLAAQGAPAPSASGLGGNPFLPIDYPSAIAQQGPFGISDTGKIVGFYDIPPDLNLTGSYVLSGTTFKSVAYPGAPATSAYGINKSGAIVGTYCDPPSCDTYHAFMLKGKKYTSFDFPGAIDTTGNAINAAGDIVGVYETPDSVLHGYLLHKGVFTSFDAPGAVFETWPYAINSQGTIVGAYEDAAQSLHGFIVQNGVIAQLDYPGAIDTLLFGVNDNLDMVGSFTTDGITEHGFLLSAGNYTSFDVPFSGVTYTQPSAINNHHQIVGSYGGGGYSFGFLTTY